MIKRVMELEKPQTGFPPYDIFREDNDNIKIVLAVAGFTKDNIEVTLENGKLIVSGNISTENVKPVDYIYKGIAERNFRRSFTLADTVEVTKVSLTNGLLEITLKNIIPESKKIKVFTVE